MCGGYEALSKTLRQHTPEQTCAVIEHSGLRGRGGGGFTSGKKWNLARLVNADQKYLVCNADEGDPGAFMDRSVIESDPFRLLEGMAIAGLRHRRQQGHHLHPRGIPAGHRTPAHHDSRSTGRGISRAQHPGLGLRFRRQHQAGRRRFRVRRRNRAHAQHRRPPRHAARATALSRRSRACGANPPASTTSRPWPTCRAS